MTDTLGLATIPIAAPAAATDVVGDMLLQRLGAFLQAAINANGNTAWRTRHGGASANVVEYVFYHNPDRLFDERRLPALYLWRSSFSRSRDADLVLKQTSRITIYWFEEPAQEARDIVRAPFEASVYSIMQQVLFRERDPSWVATGDTEAMAATRGSFLPTHLGYNWALLTGGNELTLSKTIEDGDGPKTNVFRGLATGLDVEEILVLDGTTGTYDAALDLELLQGGRHAGDIYDPDGDPLMFGTEILRNEFGEGLELG